MATRLPGSKEMLLETPGEDSLSQHQITWRLYFEKSNGEILLCTLDLDNSWTGEDCMRVLCAEYRKLTSIWERLLTETILMRKPSVAIAKIRSVGSKHE